MKRNLTDRLLRSLRAPAKGSAFIWDKSGIAGFGVRVTAGGTIAFVLDYRNKAGVSRRFTIGQWDEWKVERAREEARDLRVQIDKGVDPVQAEKDKIAEEARKIAEQARTATTVKDICDAYMKRHVLEVNGPDQQKNARDMINKVIVPRFGERRADALTKDEVTNLHVAIGGTPDKPKHKYRANQVLTVLKAAFNKGIEWGMCATNPAEGIKRHQEDKRQNWLDETQLAKLDRAITEYGQDSGELIRLLILSGSRRGEWMRAKKEDFDLAHGIWTKPSHTVKERVQEHLQLNDATMVVLKRVFASTAKDEPYLFPGTAKGTPRKTVRRPWIQILRTAGLVKEYTVAGKRGPLTRYRPTIRLHDLRHSYASWLAEDGVPLPKIGKLLGHQLRETTDRYVHIADKSMREATNRFGDMITRLVQ